MARWSKKSVTNHRRKKYDERFEKLVRRTLEKEENKKQIYNKAKEGEEEDTSQKPIIIRASRGKAGYRADLGYYMRSTWEANYGRYLNWLMKQGKIYRWEYEPERFGFPIKRGTNSYLPDFQVWRNSDSDSFYYVEIKGYMDAKSATKIRRFRKYYPHLELIVIDGPLFRQVAEYWRIIPGWEKCQL